MGKGKEVKPLTKQYQFDTTTKNLPTPGFHAFEVAKLLQNNTASLMEHLKHSTETVPATEDAAAGACGAAAAIRESTHLFHHNCHSDTKHYTLVLSPDQMEARNFRRHVCAYVVTTHTECVRLMMCVAALRRF